MNVNQTMLNESKVLKVDSQTLANQTEGNIQKSYYLQNQVNSQS
jgi:hypothetical protein